MGHQNATITGLAASATTFLVMLQAELDDAGKPGDAVRTALQGVAETCTALQNAKAKGAQILADPRLAPQAKASDARALVGAAITAAQAAGTAYANALDSAAAALQAAMLPKKPSMADSAMMAFTAEQATKLLEGVKHQGGSVEMQAGKLLADALATGDDMTAYVVASGPLSLVYQRLGVDKVALQREFARVLGQRQNGDGTAISGAALLTKLSKGGDGTLRGYDAWIRATLFNEAKNYDQSLSGYLALVGADSTGHYAVQR